LHSVLQRDIKSSEITDTRMGRISVWNIYPRSAHKRRRNRLFRGTARYEIL